MYYLQSRYYDPNTCRFINADGALYHSSLGYNLFVYCENAPVGKIDITGQYCVDIMDDDGNPFNDWLLECASGGGAKAGYYGPGTSYYNYQVRTGTAAYDARLGGYHSTGLSSAMINPKYYCVSGAVTVTDSMATSKGSTTVVYRSVSEAEAVDIINTGKFNLHSKGMDCKQFGFDYNETLQYGKWVKQSIVVSAEVPTNSLNRFYTQGVDCTIFRHGTLTVYGDDLDYFNYLVQGSIKILK